MNADEISTVAVLGAGTMGNGIAHVFARSGYTVFLRDVDHLYLDRALNNIALNLDREVRKGKFSEVEKRQILARIMPIIDLAAIGAADFIIEAVPERLDLKLQVLAEASHVLRAGAILATNTSSISVTALAGTTLHPERFLGMHFMNPVPVMPLVEVIRAKQTSEDAFAVSMQLCEKIGKKAVAVNDSPGFVSNRVLIPLINEAAFCVMEGVATPQAVDEIMKLGMNHPMGPLELADFIGLDVCVDIMEVLQRGFNGDSKYRPCPLLREMVDAGHLGKKSGRGFYVYKY